MIRRNLISKGSDFEIQNVKIYKGLRLNAVSVSSKGDLIAKDIESNVYQFSAATIDVFDAAGCLLVLRGKCPENVSKPPKKEK